MTVTDLTAKACDKGRFLKPTDYINFAKEYLEYIKDNLQAVIVSKNENHYRFFQYNEEASFNVTRPINSLLMYRRDSRRAPGKQIKHGAKNKRRFI